MAKQRNPRSQIAHAEIHLPYWKQGDDMNEYTAAAKTTKETQEGLEKFAQHWEGVAKYLRDLAKEIEGAKHCYISGDTHCIFIESTPSMIDHLLEKELVQKDPSEEEDDEEEDDEEDDNSGEEATGESPS